MNEQLAIDLIKKHEGLRLFPYDDGYGNLTIGYGLNISDGITMAEAEMLLLSRVKTAVIDVMKVFGSDAFGELSRLRQAVLIDMAYNLGINRLATFGELIRAIQIKDFEMAADEMLDSKWSTQVGYRAINLATLMRTNEER